jgi:hypothetical protein
VEEQQREAAIAVEPVAVEKLWWGSKVRGVRVLLAEARSELVTELLYSAWCHKAPPALVKSFASPSGVAK